MGLGAYLADPLSGSFCFLFLFLARTERLRGKINRVDGVLDMQTGAGGLSSHSSDATDTVR